MNAPEGEGWVSFSVDPVEGQPSGTVFENRAEIVFDMNPPIITNAHRNILDERLPVTTMLPLPDLVETDTLRVHFDSDDGEDGSGVQCGIPQRSVGCRQPPERGLLLPDASGRIFGNEAAGAGEVVSSCVRQDNSIDNLV